MVDVFTARMGSRDPDALDITRKSATWDGLAFAPSWEILRPTLDLRAKLAGLTEGAQNATREGLHDTARDLRRQAIETGISIERAWDSYVGAYTSEMRRSYVERRAAWDGLLSRERVVLLCYCPDHTRCHRTVLGREILPKLGAVYGGELARVAKNQSEAAHG